jgi:hypothetical protein
MPSNLSLVLRKRLGAGTPRGLAALKNAIKRTCKRLVEAFGAVLTRYRGPLAGDSSPIHWTTFSHPLRFARLNR